MVGFYRVFGFVAICVVLGSLALWVMNRDSGSKETVDEAPAEDGAKPPLVTLEEYFELEDGISYGRAVAVIGVEGELFQEIGQTPESDEPPSKKIYTWTNPDGSRLTLIFDHNKLVAKEPVDLK